MSSVSSIGGGSSLYSFLQSINQSNQSSSTTATTAATTNTTATSTDPLVNSSSSSSSSGVQGHHRHGHHGGGGGDKSGLFSQLQQTVSTALQTAQQNGTDPNQAIQDAIAKVFQNNNTAATSSASTSGASTSGATDPDAAQANTPASVNGATTANPASGTSSLQAFFQTLQSFGVNPQQFHQDFLNAAQGVQNGTSDANSAFQSFPPGSLIDTTG